MRAAIGETAIEALHTELRATGEASWSAQVRHDDGRHWSVEVRRGAPGPLRAASCGRAPDPSTPYDVDLVTEEAR